MPGATPDPTPGRPGLSPTAFLTRAATSFGDRVAYVDDDQAFTYTELAARCRRLAGGLRDLGVGAGDRVSVLAPNTNVLLEAHFGVPWLGAVLNAINTRLGATEIRHIVDHAEPKVLIADREMADLARTATDGLPVRVVVSGEEGYEQLVATGDDLAEARPVADDHLLALNYTSGTTGRPKGVMYSHRGAYLQALAMHSHFDLRPDHSFLWTLPMFHCNGWCFPWAVTAAGATHVGLRRIVPDEIWTTIATRGITHLNAAPTVLTSLVYSPAASAEAGRSLHVATGGAPPSPTLLRGLEDLGISVTHLYGLTETYGPAVICDWQEAWRSLDDEERYRRMARQGIPNVLSSRMRIVADDGDVAERDGTTVGEVQLQGENVMLGYYRDEEATAAADDAGWFRTGDVGVIHPDGYLELRDRAKDVIISGGENISSIEVEQALVSHPAVMECAVVAAPDEHWGEVPVAFVVTTPEATATAAELIDHVKGRIARFKAPKRIVFGELPKTPTGKIQKYVLREALWPEDGPRIG